MTPPTSIMGQIVHLRFLGAFKWRLAFFGVAILVFLVLALFPERYKGSASITPADSESMGLSGTLGQLGAINNVFGNQAAVEVALRTAKSVYVRDRVIDDSHVAPHIKGRDRLEVHRWLQKRIEIRSLRGGVIIVEFKDRDPALARDIVAAYVRATQDQLALMSRRQTAYKRNVLRKLAADAQTELAEAQANYDRYRLANRYVDPRESIGAASARIPLMEADIKTREVALSAARKTYTEDNLIVKRQVAELATIRQQLAAAKATLSQNEQSVGALVGTSSQLFKLERDLTVARQLYDNYMRYLQGTAVEDLTSTASLRVLEDAYVDTRRQLYIPALIAALGFFLLWMAVEFYRLRPPVGDRLDLRASYD